MMVPTSSQVFGLTGFRLSGAAKLDSTRTRMRCVMASSTERVCSTLEPSEAISSISS